MPSFFPEGDAPLATDPSNKSLQKINSLLQLIESNTGGASGGGLTNAELRATPVPVDIGGSGSITITSGTVTVSNEVEVKNDSGHPVPISDNGSSLTVDGTVGISGTVPVSGTFWQATQPVSGSVSVANFPATQPVSDAGGSLTVDGSVSVSNFPATQPVSGSVSVSNLPTSYPVTDNGGSLTVDGTVGISGTVPVSGTFWQATQPVSGTVTANAGTGTFATSSTQLPTALVSDRLKVDGSGVTQPVSGSISVSNFPASQAVTGTFWQATQPISGTVTAAQTTAANLNATVVGSGSFTAAQATAANLNATVVQGTATNLKTQAENYQGGSAVSSANPLQVTLANTGANSTAVKVEVSAVYGTVMLQGSNGDALDEGGVIPTSQEKATTPNVFTFSEESSSVVVEDNGARKAITIFNSSANTLYLILGDIEVSSGMYSFALGEKELLVLTNITSWINGIYPDGGTAYVTEIT